eukprot:1272625-Rhodomonas_salina.1
MPRPHSVRAIVVLLLSLSCAPPPPCHVLPGPDRGSAAPIGGTPTFRSPTFSAAAVWSPPLSAYLAPRCPVLTQHVVPSAYARAMRCP